MTRNDVVNKGFKPLFPADDKTKHARKKAPKTPPSAGKTNTFITPQPEFLDLAAIDRCFSSGLTYPHIPVHELQKVATDSCGISLVEVANEHLMNAEAMEPGKGEVQTRKD
jgi:hypothetical protein